MMMKKFLFVLGVITMFAGMYSCANIYKMNKAELVITSVTDVTTNPAKWEEIAKDIQSGKEYVFHIPKGESIPFQVKVSTDYFHLKPGKNTLEFDRDVYLMISKTVLRISPDGESWADLQDMHSLKTLLGYQKGSFTMGLSASKDTGPQINIELTAK